MPSPIFLDPTLLFSLYSQGMSIPDTSRRKLEPSHGNSPIFLLPDPQSFHRLHPPFLSFLFPPRPVPLWTNCIPILLALQDTPLSSISSALYPTSLSFLICLLPNQGRSPLDFCPSSTFYFPTELLKRVSCSHTRISFPSYLLLLPSTHAHLIILQNTCHFLFFTISDVTVGTFRVDRFFLWNTFIFWLSWHQIILLFLYFGFSSTWPLSVEIPVPFSLFIPILPLRDLIFSHGYQSQIPTIPKCEHLLEVHNKNTQFHWDYLTFIS